MAVKCDARTTCTSVPKITPPVSRAFYYNAYVIPNAVASEEPRGYSTCDGICFGFRDLDRLESDLKFRGGEDALN